MLIFSADINYFSLLHAAQVGFYSKDNFQFSNPASQMYDDLLACDQLKLEQSSGNVFQGFKEGNIQFSPTYKYRPSQPL